MSGKTKYVLRTAMCLDGNNVAPGTVVSLEDEDGILAVMQGTASIAPAAQVFATPTPPGVAMPEAARPQTAPPIGGPPSSDGGGKPAKK